MKKRIAILFVLWFAALMVVSAQSSNLVKYWQYRNRLEKQFLVKGLENPCQNYGGFCVPVSERNNTNKEPNHIKFGDDLKDMGWYVGVLATEFLLLSAGNDHIAAQNTLNDLYMAMKAIERFDTKAEWLAPPKQASGCTAPNGFLSRDETGDAFFANNFRKFFPNFTGTPQFNVNYNTDLTGNSQENHFSVDHVMSILMGYALVRRCLPATISHSSGYNFYTESYLFTNRIMNRMASNNWINCIPNTPAQTLSFTDIIAHGTKNPMLKLLVNSADAINILGTALTGIPNPIPISGKPVHLDLGYEMISLLPGWVDAANYRNPAPVSGPYLNNTLINTAWQEMQPKGKLEGKIKGTTGYRREMIFTLAAIGNNWKVCPKATIKECALTIPVQDGCNVWFDKRVDPCFGAFGGCAFTIKECIVPHFKDECALWVDMSFDDCTQPKENNTLKALCVYGKDTKQEFYALLNMFLHEKVADDKWMTRGNFESILNSAPCDGPRYMPSDNRSDLGTAGWRAANKWEKSDIAESGSKDHNSGYFNGLDYMLTYNLFALTYGHLLTENGIAQYTTSRGNYIENDVTSYPNASSGTVQSPYNKSVIKSVTSKSCIGCSSIQADVTYNAGEQVVLSPGFRVGNGSKFTASIKPYTTCNGPYNFRLENARIGSTDEFEDSKKVNIVSNNFTLFPNPITTGNLNFGRIVNNYTLMNSTGAVIQQGANAEKLDVTGLSKGMYMLKLDDKIEKVIVE